VRWNHDSRHIAFSFSGSKAFADEISHFLITGLFGSAAEWFFTPPRFSFKRSAMPNSAATPIWCVAMKPHDQSVEGRVGRCGLVGGC
jgi:hypothetical protein